MLNQKKKKTKNGEKISRWLGGGRRVPSTTIISGGRELAVGRGEFGGFENVA